jgi:hypothetical protein
MKAYCGTEDIAPRILDLGTRWEWSASRPGHLTPRESHWYPLYKRLGGPQCWSGRGGEEKNSQPFNQI